MTEASPTAATPRSATSFLASSSDLTWSYGNGLGINCLSSVNGCSIDSAYQIGRGSAHVQFEHSVFLTSVDIALLNTTGLYTLRVDETGSIVGNGFDIDFDSDYANDNGSLTVRVNRWVTSLRFVPDAGEWNDFTLARLRIDGTAWLRRQQVPAATRFRSRARCCS
jgi:hypothetical protein